jgi:hypothetical protein
MRDIYEILRLKEIELSRVGAEVEALRIAAPLLTDETESDTPVSTRWSAPTRPLQVPRAANSNPQPERAADWKERTVGFP